MTESSVRWLVLGPVELHSSGRQIPVPGGTAGRLLALLLAQAGSPISVDLIADQLWNRRPPQTARKFIQVMVHRLRRLAPVAGRLEHTSQGYLLRRSDVDYDAARFEDLVARAADLLQADDLSMADAVLTHALGTWRGPAFAGVDDVPLVAEQRGRLAELKLAAFEDHIDVRLVRGHDHGVVDQLRDVIADHPFRERLRAQLMLALYRSGRVADALEEYRVARTALASELGVDPSSELEKLHQRMLHRDPQLSRAAAPSRAFLPRDVPEFTGREAELAWLDRRACGQSSTAVISAVDGMGGIGKTALMIHWAHRRTSRFPDGQFFVRLHGTAEQALHHLLGCLGVAQDDLPPSTDDAAARYRSLLAGKRALILIDGAESADQVRPLLPGSAECFVMVTGRSRLSGLVACDGARQLTLAPLSEPDAESLLRRLVGDSRLDAEPSEALKIVKICGGVPLALRIAAAQLAERPTLLISDYVAELTACGPVNSLAMKGDEQRGIRAVFDTSLDRMPRLAREIFSVLGAIPGADFTAAAVAAAAGITVREASSGLPALAAAHLVEIPRPDRYALHDLLRDYARQLPADPIKPLNRLLDLHRHLVGSALSVLRPGLRAPDVPKGLLPTDLAVPDTTESATAWLSIEYANLAAGISAAAAANLTNQVRGLIDPLWQLCHHHGRIGQWIGTFERVVKDIDEAGGDSLAVLNTLGNAYVMAGQYPNAIAAHRRCVDAWSTGVDAARARTNLAASLDQLGDHTGALYELRIALATFRDADLPTHQAYVLDMMARNLQLQGRPAEAHAALLQALPLIDHRLSTTDLARTLNTLADVCLDLGRVEEAISHADRASNVARESGNRHLQAMTVTTHASILRELGRFEESIRLWIYAGEELTALGMAGTACESRVYLADTYAVAGRTDLALDAYQEVIDGAQGLGAHRLRVLGLLGIAACDPNRRQMAVAEAFAIVDGHPMPENIRARLTSLGKPA